MSAQVDPLDLDELEALRADPKTGQEWEWATLKAARWRCEAVPAVPVCVALLMMLAYWWGKTEREKR